jgi:valyl-tRNA synthetase
MDLPNKYDSKESEPKWQKFWEENKINSFDPEDTTREIYSIDTPPPTVSGKMHMGHAFGNSQQDFIARYKRMQGFNVLQPFGTDDNGLPTQTLIQKIKKVRARDMPRKEFIKLCLETLEKELRPQYTQDWKRLGISCDFNVFYTTINEHSQRISQWSFIDLYNKGKAYRKKAPVMICPRCRTSIAQVELEDKELASNLNYIKAKTETGEYIIYATTRPELHPGCVGISLNEGGDYVTVERDNKEKWIISKDAVKKMQDEFPMKIIEEYKGRDIVGKLVQIPLAKQPVPITHDISAKTEYGSGIVFYCTYGGVDCIEWMQRHPDVKSIPIMDFTGRYNKNAGKYQGMMSEEARKEVVKDLKEKGILLKQQPMKHSVNTHERCGVEIEYVEETQWFIRLLELKEKLLELGNALDWHPKHMKNRYDNWTDGLKWDWNISRQIFFGVPFPVWYCKDCNETIVANEEQLPVDPTQDKAPVDSCPKCESKNFVGESDIINTWATSSLTPTIVKELFKGKPVYDKLNKHPMDLRPQGHDIISFWLFNTVAKSHLHFDMKPWNNCFINGWMLDSKGKKMSKSKGNVIEPQGMIEKYSADSLRFMSAGKKLGEDFPFQEKDLLTGQKFINKLWNASKFGIMHLEDFAEHGQEVSEVFDQWLLSKLQKIVQESIDSYDNYAFFKPKAETENFFWHIFCDQYLEIAKDRLYNPTIRGDKGRKSAQKTLYLGIISILKLMAPIMPHITEEIYQLYFASQEKIKSIHISKWPEFNSKLINEKAELAGDIGIDIINTVRKFKSDNQLSLKEELKELILISVEAGFQEIIKSIESDLKPVLKVKSLIFVGETSLVSEKFEIKIGVKK